MWPLGDAIISAALRRGQKGSPVARLQPDIDVCKHSRLSFIKMLPGTEEVEINPKTVLPVAFEAQSLNCNMNLSRYQCICMHECQP